MTEPNSLSLAAKLASAAHCSGLAPFESRGEIEKHAGDIGPLATQAEIDETWRWLINGDAVKRISDLWQSGRGPDVFSLERIDDDGVGWPVTLSDFHEAPQDEVQRIFASSLVRVAAAREALDLAVAEFVVCVNQGRATGPDYRAEPA